MNATTQVAAAIQDGGQLTLELRGQRVTLQIHGVCQRNWSRVAVGELSPAAPGQDKRVFVKQFVDRRGELHVDHMQSELAGSRAAAGLAGGESGDAGVGMRALPVVGSSDEQLVLCYPWEQLITPDELLRSDPAACADRMGALVAQSRTLLDALASCPEQLAATLKRKDRPYGGASRALNLKGLDIRNCAWPCSEPGVPEDGLPWLFDCGRPYLAPIEEAAAKLLVSFGLLNWGWPMRRFWRGPDAALWQQVARSFGPYVDRDAVLAEIALQERIRMGEFQGRNVAARLGKRLTVEVVGRRYLRRLRHLCADLSATSAGEA